MKKLDNILDLCEKKHKRCDIKLYGQTYFLILLHSGIWFQNLEKVFYG